MAKMRLEEIKIVDEKLKKKNEENWCLFNILYSFMYSFIILFTLRVNLCACCVNSLLLFIFRSFLLLLLVLFFRF